MTTSQDTPYGYFRKVGYGQYGVVEWTNFLAKLDIADAELNSLAVALPALNSLVAGWAVSENQDILIPNCSYTAANQFTVSGADLTAQFTENKPVRAKLSDNTYKGSTVASSSYVGGNTVVTLNDPILFNPELPMYGNYWRWSRGLGNLQAGSANNHDILSFRFVAKYTGYIDSVVGYWMLAVGSTYSAGDGGIMRCEFQGDDETENHLPSGVALASFQITVDADQVAHTAAAEFGPLANGCSWIRLYFSVPVYVQAGELYHIVFTNPAADPVTNYWSVDCIFNNPAMATQMQPAYSDIDLAVLIKRDAVWDNPRRLNTPIFTVYYVDGRRHGQPYMQLGYPLGLNGFPIYGATHKIRQKFIPSATQVVTAVNINAYKMGTPPQPLVIKVLDSGLNTIAEGEVAASEFVADLHDPRWGKVTFDSPLTLAIGSIYYIEASSSGGDDSNCYRTWSSQNGHNYGLYGDGFDDASAAGNYGEYMNGAGWIIHSNYDMQVYFDRPITPIGGIWLTATRDGLFPYGPGYVVARDYGVPGQAAFDAALAAIGVLDRTLVLTPGNWGRPTADPLTNVEILPMWGATIDPGATNLTISKLSPHVGNHQWISLSGAGRVLFGPEVHEIKTSWYGDDPLKTVDSVPAFQAAHDASYYSQKQVVVTGYGSFRWSTTLTWMPLVPWRCQGYGTKFYPTDAVATMIDDSAGQINPATGGQRIFQMLQGGFDVYGEDNGGNFTVFVTVNSLLSLIVLPINLYGDVTYIQKLWYHEGDPVMNCIFGPWFWNDSMPGTGITDATVYFNSDPTACNGNVLIIKTGGGGTPYFLGYSHNWKVVHFQNTPPADQVSINVGGYVTGGKDWSGKISGSGNILDSNSWLETKQAFLGLEVKSKDQVIIEARGPFYSDDVLDRHFFDMYWGEDYPIAPTYVSGSQVTWVDGTDRTADFAVGRHMLWQGANGVWGSNLVLSSSYVAGNMTVNRDTTTTGPAFPADIALLMVGPEFKRVNVNTALAGYSVRRDYQFRERIKIGKTGPWLSESAGSGVLVPSLGGIAELNQTLVYAADVEIDGSLGLFMAITLTGDVNFLPPINIPIGTTFTLEIIQNAVGGHAVTFDAVFKHAWSNTGNTANKVSVITFHRRNVGYRQKGPQLTYY